MYSLLFVIFMLLSPFSDYCVTTVMSSPATWHVNWRGVILHLRVTWETACDDWQ